MIQGEIIFNQSCVSTRKPPKTAYLLYCWGFDYTENFKAIVHMQA